MDVGEREEGEENPLGPLQSALSIIAIVFFFFFLIGVIMGINCGDPGMRPGRTPGEPNPFAGLTGKEAVARAGEGREMEPVRACAAAAAKAAAAGDGEDSVRG